MLGLLCNICFLGWVMWFMCDWILLIIFLKFFFLECRFLYREVYEVWWCVYDIYIREVYYKGIWCIVFVCDFDRGEYFG